MNRFEAVVVSGGGHRAHRKKKLTVLPSVILLGSVSGTSPGTARNGIHIPVNVDLDTEFTIGSADLPNFVEFRGILKSKGEATASFLVPSGLPPSADVVIGVPDSFRRAEIQGAVRTEL